MNLIGNQMQAEKLKRELRPLFV